MRNNFSFLKSLVQATNGINAMLPKFNVNEITYIYNSAVKKFKTNNYKEAINLFQLLNMCDAQNDLYAKGLAGSFHANKEYELGLFWYQYTYMLENEKHIDCLYYCGVVLFELAAIEESLIYFNEFVKKCNKEKYCSLIEEALLYIKLIEHKKVLQEKSHDKQ